MRCSLGFRVSYSLFYVTLLALLCIEISSGFMFHPISFDCRVGVLCQSRSHYITIEPRYFRKDGLYNSLNDQSTSMGENSDDGSDSDSQFLESLRNRLKQVTDRETKIPLVVLDAMLPRQVLKIKVQNDLFIRLIQDRWQEERPTFGMLGIAKASSGEVIQLMHGVEVQISGKPSIIRTPEDGTSIQLELKGGRRFVLRGEIETAPQGWTQGRVEFVSSSQQESSEASESSLEDRMALARAIQRSREFTSPNFQIAISTTTKEGEEKERNLCSLIDRWIHLARERERSPGQIDQLLLDLGEIPPIEEPSERAFWVGALINPIPAMGVALEIRPALLTARTAEERTLVALDGIIRSIKHMDGSAPMW
jgi:ATP-dependent protease La (LON) substrate-binding domain